MNRADLQEALTHPNVSAFLRVIREGESSQDDNAYRMLFGGELFDSFEDHPHRVITKGGYSSSAAGAYQFLSRTWDGLVVQYGFPNFSPECQDEGAVALIRGRLALDHVIAGRLEDALPACGKEWASLPGSPYGQPTLSKERAIATFLKWGGTLCEEMQGEENAPVDPITSPFTETVVPQEKPVAPLIPIIASGLAQLIPALSKAFGGTEVSDRNLQVATKAVEVISTSIGAVNAQDCLEKVQRSPEALQAAKAAVEREWFAIVGESSGGGLAAARAADLAAQNAPNGFWRSPTFWIALVLVPAVYLILVSLLYPSIGGDWTPETRAAIIGGVMGTVLGSITQYYMGSTTQRNRPQ